MVKQNFYFEFRNKSKRSAAPLLLNILLKGLVSLIKQEKKTWTERNKTIIADRRYECILEEIQKNLQNYQ